MSAWAIACSVLFVLVVILAVSLFIVLRPGAVKTTGQPTNDEKRIVVVDNQKRTQIEKETTGSAADVKRLSNEDLERAVNHPDG